MFMMNYAFQQKVCPQYDTSVSIAVTLRLASSELPTVVRKLRGGGGGGGEGIQWKRNSINLKRKKSKKEESEEMTSGNECEE